MALSPILRPSASMLSNVASAGTVAAKDLTGSGALPTYGQMLPTPTDPSGANWSVTGTSPTLAVTDRSGGSNAFTLTTAGSGSAEFVQCGSAYLGTPEAGKWHTLFFKLKKEGSSSYAMAAYLRPNGATAFGLLKVKKSDGTVFTSQTGLTSATFAAGVASEVAYASGTWFNCYVAVKGAWPSASVLLYPTRGPLDATNPDTQAGTATICDMGLVDGLYAGDPPPWFNAGAVKVPVGGDLSYLPLVKAKAPRVTVAGTSLTLSAAHYGAILEFTSSSAVTVTVPTGLPSGFDCVIVNVGTGLVSIAGSGTTILKVSTTNATLASQGSTAKLTQLESSANTYSLDGDLEVP